MNKFFKILSIITLIFLGSHSFGNNTPKINTAITAQFATPAKSAHFVGQAAAPIIIICLTGDVESMSGVSGDVLAFLQWCNDATDLFGYFKWSVGLVRTGAGKLMALITDDAGNTMVTQLGSDLFSVKVIAENASEATEVSMSREQLETLMNNTKAGSYTDVNGSSYKIAGEEGDQIIRQTWNGFTNIFKGTPDEIAEATERIKEYRIAQNTGTQGNYGYLEGTVNGNAVDNGMWRSGTANVQTEPQIFTAIEVEGANGNSWLRNTDAEYKMLNKLADDLGGKSGNIYTDIQGELKIVSENPYCASCQGIIQQFNQMFPNIKLILIDGAK